MADRQPAGTGAAPDDPLAAHAERLERVDNREADHFRDLAQRLSDLGTTLTGIKGTLTGQSEILRSLAGINEKVDELEAAVRSLLPKDKRPGEDYQPRPTIRWWQLRGNTEAADDRAAFIARLRYWAEELVFVPGYGYLAAMLPSCWAQHEFCLYTLDWLCESWSVLYITEERTKTTLAAQAEFQTRILPAACEQLGREGEKCDHEQRQPTAIAPTVTRQSQRSAWARKRDAMGSAPCPAPDPDGKGEGPGFFHAS